MPSKLLKNSSILFFSFPFAGSNIITSFFFILCTITKWLNPSFVITWAIDGKVYFSLNPTLSTLIALASKPNFLAPFSNPNKVVPFISVPRISLNLVIVTSFLYYMHTVAKQAAAQSVISCCLTKYFLYDINNSPFVCKLIF